jgi:hypothetical protein
MNVRGTLPVRGAMIGPAILLAICFAASCCFAEEVDITLGAAGNFAVLDIGCSSDPGVTPHCATPVSAGTVTNSNVTIVGNQGIGFGGSVNNMAPSHVTGNGVQYSSGQFTGSIDTGHIAGGIVTDPVQMNQAYLDAMNAFNTVKGLSAFTSQTFGTGGNLGVLNITGVSGLNIIQLNGTINNQINLMGPSNAFFVFNVTGNLNISGSSIVGNSTTISPDHILWNFITSGSTLSSMVDNQVFGTLLAPNSSFQGFHGAFGAIIRSQSGSLMSGATVTQDPFIGFSFVIPEPKPTLSVLGISFVMIAGAAWRRRKPVAIPDQGGVA